MSIKLEIELVPRTAWWSNVRSNVSKADWEICKRYVRQRSGGRCEICGGQGGRWPVECHEVWHYDDQEHIQTLVDLIALCPACHQAKHLGRSEVVLSERDMNRLYAHIANVNRWPLSRVSQYRDLVFKIWALRSREDWKLDVSYLRLLGIDPKVTDREA